LQYHVKQLGRIVIALIGISMGIVAVLLFIEYRFFHDQAQKMMQLKEEYRAYMSAVKKVLNEYNAMKEQADSTQEAVAELSPEQQEQKDSFMVVNRELGYLKQSMIDYMREQRVESVIKRIDLNDWIDYTDHVIQAQKKPKKRKKTKGTVRRTGAQGRARHLYGITEQMPKDLVLTWPIDRSQFWLSSFFGPRRKPNRSWGFHYGIDMAACRGTPVYAAAEGVVVEACASQKGYGNTIVIQHNHKYKTRYAHLQKILVGVGKKVERGDLIGKVGSTGAVRSRKGKDASHLHFEVYSFGKQINPLYFFL